MRRGEGDRNSERQSVDDHIQEGTDQESEYQSDWHNGARRDLDRHAPPIKTISPRLYVILSGRSPMAAAISANAPTRFT